MIEDGGVSSIMIGGQRNHSRLINDSSATGLRTPYKLLTGQSMISKERSQPSLPTKISARRYKRPSPTAAAGRAYKEKSIMQPELSKAPPSKIERHLGSGEKTRRNYLRSFESFEGRSSKGSVFFDSKPEPKKIQKKQESLRTSPHQRAISRDLLDLVNTGSTPTFLKEKLNTLQSKISNMERESISYSRERVKIITISNKISEIS